LAIAGNYDYEEGGICSKPEDAEFIAAARTDIPDLLATIEELRRANSWIKVTPETMPPITQRWKDGPHKYESSDRVLVFAEDRVQVGEYFGKSGNWGDEEGSTLKTPTFWRELPAPPIGTEKK
jgi:hypothetical protein